ncbi:TetR/AcrR family transcriptional regulator [Cupriavidus taiwanensis]|uniref:TetR/AcrR family transcriptional regulator n=1 Tax=Cupriavidus taiwanensis TaxID=164546 RepID=UPI000E103093|nr:TetR family transcriptional regulator [Cupriavidus taiwanensis]SOY67113.1 Transcriptional regulator RutR of pyrimidine catabolism (TetR family) [Cupriavidus taiwanensis]SOY67170.1 Transcriptional regulator RutR of pyrimidine catabolism (TetR family) [Cupriavidus taiwanensis]SOY94827.1 Transcriptional regulator RutR of pyrimidine catabolism (TetR family) [Cupriavidus taiwanensis]SOZ71741.1 Transcriptional regulator RutR of pyrimidine catabolism (TetR family) [Cupriavidus taiwanensis]SOZ86990
MRTVRQAQQERSEQTRAEILGIALEQFSTRGFDAVSLRDIAEVAGVNHAMIRYYFGNKENLWRESVAYLFERFAEEYVPPEPGSEGFSLEAVKEYIRNYVRYCARHPEHARLMMQEANRDSERLKWMAQKFIRPRHDQTVPLITYVSALTKGLQEIDPVMLLYMITAIAQVPYLLTSEMRYAHGINAMRDKAIEAHCDAVVAFIFR